jgi:hypothetical protein
MLYLELGICERFRRLSLLRKGGGCGYLDVQALVQSGIILEDALVKLLPGVKVYIVYGKMQHA